MTVYTPERIQTINSASGTAGTSGIGGKFEITSKIVGGEFGWNGSRTVSVTSSIVVVNSLGFIVDGNLLIAVIEYTENGIKRAAQIDLGTLDVTKDGEFIPFVTGHLSGKSIVPPDLDRQPVTVVVTNNAPARRRNSAGGYDRGTTTSTGIPIVAEVLVGYWITTMTQNGVMISSSVTPVYQSQIVGYKKLVSTYSGSNGGTLLK